MTDTARSRIDMSIVSSSDVFLVVTRGGDLYECQICKEVECYRRIFTLPLVAQAAVGGYMVIGKHYAVVCRDGTLWTWGSYDFGQPETGHDLNFVGNVVRPIASRVPKQVMPVCFAHQKIASVACGAESTFAVTEFGRVYSFGNGFRGELGHGDSGRTATRFTPTLIQGLKDVVVTMVATDWSHTVCVCDGGCVWSWGINTSKQLGIEGVDADFVTVPTPVTGLDKKGDVVFASTSSVSSMVVTAEGKVLAWGSNSFGQLGIRTSKIVQTPTPVVITDTDTTHTAKRFKAGEHGTKSATHSIRIQSILSLDMQTIALDYKGELWWCGHAGALETPSMSMTSPIFTRVAPELTAGMNVTAVSVCSANHMAVVLTDVGLLYTVHSHRHYKPSPDYMPILVNAESFAGDRIGPYAVLSRHTMIAFAMGIHHRLGASGFCLNLTDDLLCRIFVVCDQVCVVQSEGVRRLCGGWSENA